VVGLGPRTFQPRVPSVGLTSPCDQVSRARPTVRKNASRLEHHLRCRWVTRLVTVMGRHRQLSRDRHQRFRRLGGISLRENGAPEKDASHQPLQPTSVVTSTHWGPNSQALDLRRLARRALPDPRCRRRSVNSETEPSSTMSNSRCRHLRPWVVTWLTPRLPAAATRAVLPETLALSGVDPRQRYRLSASPVRWLHTPPVATTAPPGEPTGPLTARTRFPCLTSMWQLPRARGVFHR
jgi:hypothetical protein